MLCSHLTAIAVVHLAALLGCTQASSQPPLDRLTPALAKTALQQLMLDHPDAFELRPDVEKLAEIDIERVDTDKYRWGGIEINTWKLIYSVTVEYAGGQHIYSGKFVLREGKWTAQPAEVLRFHNSP